MKLTSQNLKRLVALSYADAQYGLDPIEKDELKNMKSGFFDINDQIGWLLINVEDAAFNLGIEALKLPTYPRRSRT